MVGQIKSKIKAGGKLLLFILIDTGFMYCTSCAKKTADIESNGLIEAVVIHDENAALTARIRIKLQQKDELALKIRKQQDKNEQWIMSDAAYEHTFSLLELQPESVYEYSIHSARNGKPHEELQSTKTFKTSGIPQRVSEFYIKSESTFPFPIDGYYLFASMTKQGCMYLLDNKGNLVWYLCTPNTIKSVKVTQNNTILAIEDEDHTPFGDGNILIERSWAGDTLFIHRKGNTTFDKTIHHDAIINNKGNYLAITNVLQGGYPGDGLVEWDAKGNKVWEWNTFDVRDEYDSNLKDQPWINSVFQDKDGNYILSLRALHQIWKINAKTGKVMWKLGDKGDIKMDHKYNFLYQHYAHIVNKEQLLLFDNGSDNRKYSRILLFNMDESQKTATIAKELKLDESYYSAIMGSVSLLPHNHFLTASSVKGLGLVLNANGQVINQISLKDRVYRMEYVLNPFKN